MFRAGEPEKLVMEHTGHRMVKALRMYERTSTSQHAAVSNVLVSPEEVQYKEAKSTECISGNGSGLCPFLGLHPIVL